MIRGWKELKNVIQIQYGLDKVQLVKQLQAEEDKLVHINNDIKFLRRCRKYDIIPEFVKVKNQTLHNKQADKLTHSYEKKMLNGHISEKYKQKHKLDRSINKIKENLNALSDVQQSHLQRFLQQQLTSAHEKYKNNQIKKFQNLLEHKMTSSSQIFYRTKTRMKSATSMSHTVINLSSYNPSKSETDLLSLGFNFALSPTKKELVYSKLRTISSIESNFDYYEIDSETLHGIRKHVKNLLTKNIMKTSSHNFYDLIQNMREREDLYILPADKGNATVLINKEDYIAKIQQMIDEGPYIELQQDPTKELLQRLKFICNKLKRQGQITEEFYKRVIIHNPRVPKFFGLPKIHKEGTPFRPINDCINSIYYNLSAELNFMISFSNQNIATIIKNAADLIQKLKGIIIPPNYKMVSFDAKSLFTTVPMKEGKEKVHIRIQTDQSWKTKTNSNLTDEGLMKLLHECTNNTYFYFNGKIYKQVDGGPMGSAITGTIADIFLQFIETNLISNNPIILMFWGRMVDDVLAFVEETQINNILDQLNKFHPNIEFTVEIEEDNKIAFLDTLIMRQEDGSLKTTVYRKPTHTDRYLNFESHHHMSNKISVVDSLVFRAFSICHQDFVDKELNHIRKTLQQNQYPLKFINDRIERMRKKFDRKSNSNHNIVQQDDGQTITVKQKEKWVPIPFIGHPSTQIANILRRKLDWKVTLTPGKKIQKFLRRIKDPEELPPQGIYEIHSLEPTPTVYIGQTGIPWPKRIDQHNDAVRLRNYDQSAVCKFVMDNRFTKNIDWSNSKLVIKEPNYNLRLLLEGLLIQQTIQDGKKVMNVDEGYKLHPIWSKLIPKIQTRTLALYDHGNNSMSLTTNKYNLRQRAQRLTR